MVETAVADVERPGHVFPPGDGMREEQTPAMPIHRIGRRPSHAGLIGEFKQPLIDDVIRPIREACFDILERDHAWMFDLS